MPWGTGVFAKLNHILTSGVRAVASFRRLFMRDTPIAEGAGVMAWPRLRQPQELLLHLLLLLLMYHVSRHVDPGRVVRMRARVST